MSRRRTIKRANVPRSPAPWSKGEPAHWIAYEHERRVWTPSHLDARQDLVHLCIGGLISAKPIKPSSGK